MDILAGVLTICGVELLRRKMWQGFALLLANEMLWLYVGVGRKMYGLVILGIFLVPQYVWGLVTWWRSAQR